jgi:hypothetical protein
MTMDFERLERCLYWKEGDEFLLQRLTGAEFDRDFTRYHDARAMLHEKAEHDWGVAAGLEVIQTDARTLKVNPGVAIDRKGRLIALSDEDAGGEALGGIIRLDDFPGLGPQACVTITYFQKPPKFDPNAPPTTGVLADRPTLGLEDPAKLGDASDAVVLAVVVRNPDGTVKELVPRHDGCKPCRKLVGVPAGEIRLRRSVSTKSPGAPAVSDTPAATLRPLDTPEGGLAIEARGPIVLQPGVEGSGGAGTVELKKTAQIRTNQAVMTGAVNDYQKAQFSMSGGGTVTWGGPGKRLKWTDRFLAISMCGTVAADETHAIPEGHVSIFPPKADLPKEQVHDNQPRKASEAEGIELRGWEALYAVHEVGKAHSAVKLRIVKYVLKAFEAPSNWLLVAVVNDDDKTVKLGTGAILSVNSSASKGCPFPIGTILLWSGTKEKIPDGWAVCDGMTAGTPNLINHFVMGAAPKSSEAEGGKSGPPETHVHAVTIAPIATSAVADHTHKVPDHWYMNRCVGDDKRQQGATVVDAGGAEVRGISTQGAGGHAHDVKIPTFNTGQSSGENRPRWYALCYIMKVS